MEYYLVFDVGGTEVKGNAVNQHGEFCFQKVITYPAKSEGSQEDIMKNLVSMIVSVIQKIEDPLKKVAGIGFAFPGPFDYEKGVCLIQGLGKYEALYKVNVRQEIKLMMENHPIPSLVLCPDYKAIFDNDAKLFAIGESEFEEGNIACFTLGTGCGSTFISDGAINKGQKGIPESGMIYDQPFKESIIDDYVSIRGLAQITSNYFEEKLTGLEIFELAASGNVRAKKVFIEFGQQIGEALGKFIDLFQTDVIILGGQLSKSYEFFKEGLNKYLPQNTEVKISSDTSMSIMYGIYLLLNKEDGGK